MITIATLGLAVSLAAAPIDDARALAVSGDVEVQLTISKNASSEGGTSSVSIDVDGNTVRVKAPARAEGARPVVRVALSALDSIEASGAARVEASGVTSKSLSVRASGTSEVVIDGKTLGTLDVKSSSSAKVDVRPPATTISASSTDASRLTVRAASGSNVNASAKKASKLVVKGKPGKLDKSAEGAARIVVE